MVAPASGASVTTLAEDPEALLPPPPPWLARVTPLASFERLGEQADALIYELIDQRRREGSDSGEDVLALPLREGS